VIAARAWHALTAVVAAIALGLQLVLVIEGGRVLEEAHPPSMTLRLLRFVAYFTVESNLLVLVSTAVLARDPAYDAPRWRVLRSAAVLGIAVTGLVHWFLLRPLLHLQGADLVADKLLHLAVPLLAVAGWLAFGPRPRMSWASGLPATVWPLACLADAGPRPGRRDGLVSLPVPRPPRARLGPRRPGVRRDPRPVVRAAVDRPGLRPAGQPEPGGAGRHW
jgi:uncharacterized membrane protein